MTRFVQLFKEVENDEVVLLYVDQAHIHRDLQLGYTWGRIGKTLWCKSSSAKLSERMNFYGVYNATDGRCGLWENGRCNTLNTLDFLRWLKGWLGKEKRRVKIIWDGAAWHKAIATQELAKELGFDAEVLPGYSPDLNPIEGLWRWLRKEVTQLHCYSSVLELKQACEKFIAQINQDPETILSRLVPRQKLDPNEEYPPDKLLFST